jgi:hypothetical protein
MAGANSRPSRSGNAGMGPAATHTGSWATAATSWRPVPIRQRRDPIRGDAHR